MFLWGSSFVAMKYAIREMDPMLIVFGRMIIASLCFLPFVRSFSRLGLQRTHILPLLGMGLCEPCLYFLFEATALDLTSASQASMITTMLPLLVALAAGLFLGESITRRVVAGLFLAAVGAVWLGLAAAVSEYAPHPVLGNFLEFLAMVAATGYIILLKKLSASLPPLFLTATQAFTGAVFFLFVTLFSGTEIPKIISLSGLLSVLYLGTFVSVGAYGLYNFAVSRVPANQAAAFINLIPVCTIVLGFLCLGERLTGWQLTACLLIFAGVMLTQYNKSEREKL
ncbi:MAG TPA: DMT family transporter [Desulfobulbaceae bacterium]|nr:DMT family transporter [Desulfobulbaceae bacterium]